MKKEKFQKYVWIIELALSIVLTITLNVGYTYENNLLECSGGNNLVWLIVCAFLYIIFDKYRLIEKTKRMKVVSIIFGIVISLFQVVGLLAQEIWRNTTAVFTQNIVIFIIIKFITYMIIASVIFSIIVDKLEKRKLKDEDKNETKKEKSFFTGNLKSFLIVFLILTVAYLPYYLNYFPGTTSFDTNYQLMQGFGIYDYTNHHPVLHTFLISSIIGLVNNLTGSYTIAFGVCSLIQMIICALIFSFVIFYMAKKKVRVLYRVLTLIFFAIAPFICQLNIAIWKDTPFSLLVLLMVIPLIEIATNKEDFFKNYKKIILTIILFIFIPFLKNTGIYVLAITFPIILFTNIKYWKKVVIIFAIPILTYAIVTGPVFDRLNIAETESAEILTIPIQQMARIEKYRSDELTREEQELIHKYIPTDDIAQRYNPTIVDLVKEKFANDVFKENKVEFFKLFLKFTLKFPDETIAAFACNSFGYYYPEVVTYSLGSDTYETPLNEQQFMRIKRTPIIKINLIDETIKQVYDKEIPIVSLVANLGFYFWILILIFFINIYYKKYNILLIFIPYIIVFLTAIASPVSGELRYVYAMLLSLPILISFTLENYKIKNKEEEYDENIKK